jgi:phosphoribosylformylglycinamidine cyclo-ligase
VLKAIMKGIIDGCKQAGCALLGGETAEMPETYIEGEYDLAGFAVGVAERDQIFSAKDVRVDDVLIGLPSSGVHSNGFSLVRKIIGENPSAKLLKELLTPTRIYTKLFDGLQELRPKIKGVAHITGGGMGENIPRVIPADCDAVIKVGSWPVLPVFSTLQKMGHVETDEMFRVFNMGIGLVLIVDPEARSAVLRELKKMGESAHEIGIISRGKNRVRFVYT